MSFLNREKEKLFTEINITPLTDIFLVLLIIMMVVAPLLDKQGISLTVPENVEQTQMDDKEPQILTIVVTDNDKYLINNEEVSPDILGTVLSQEIQKYPDGLLIQADGEASHGAVVKLMDKARYAGVKAISMDKI